MAKLTMLFGVLLVALGATAFVMTGSVAPTALIPAWFGLALLLCGALANTEKVGQRMLWMHIAVTLALIGFVFPFARSIMAFVQAHQEMTDLAHPAAVYEEMAMAGLCLLFTLLCVRSFITARRTRVE